MRPGSCPALMDTKAKRVVGPKKPHFPAPASVHFGRRCEVEMDRPYLQLFTRDWLDDLSLRSVSCHSRGVLADLMCIAHESKPYGFLSINDQKMSIKLIASRCNMSAGKVERAMLELEKFGRLRQNEQGVWFVPRMVKDEEIRVKRAAGGYASIGHPSTPTPKHPEGYPSAHPRSLSEGGRPFTRARTIASDSDSDVVSSCVSDSETRARVGSAGVQTEFIRRARSLGLICKSEARFPSICLQNGETLELRADVAILDSVSNKAIFLVECKDYSQPERGGLKWQLTAQFEKYKASGLPFALCGSMEQIDETLDNIRALIGWKPAGFELDEQWTDFRAVANSVGLDGSSADWDSARWQWRPLDPLQKQAATAGLLLRQGTDDPALKALPTNYLKRRMWERTVRTGAVSKGDAVTAKWRREIAELEANGD